MGPIGREHSREQTIWEVNPLKWQEALTNVHARDRGTDDAVKLTPPTIMSLEQAPISLYRRMMKNWSEVPPPNARSAASAPKKRLSP